MGIFLRKSFRAGPMRFNLSKSGLGMSTGIKGLRVGMGPRGAYVGGGAKGLYFRKNLSTGSRQRTSQLSAALVQPAPQRVHSKSSGNTLTVLAFLAILFGLAFLLAALVVPGLLFTVGGFGLLIKARKSIASIKKEEDKDVECRRLLERIVAAGSRDVEAAETLGKLRAASPGLQTTYYKKKFSEAYEEIVESAIEDGLNDEEKRWLASVSGALGVEAAPIHRTILGEAIIATMADMDVTDEERQLIAGLCESLGVKPDSLPEPFAALEQFARAKEAVGNLPRIDAGISLQRNEVCHHRTNGALMDMKTIRSYTIEGEKRKDEELAVSKEGGIYITSKRVLIVGDGTSSIAHEKILDVDIDLDTKTITVTKDGRQKPLYIRVPDAIYCGLLIEKLSEG